MTTALCLATLLFASAPSAQQPPSAAEQIAAALLAAPEELREDAGVLGFDPNGRLVTLREPKGDLLCLADTPGNDTFSAACYHRDLEPYMARGRELAAEGVTGPKRNEIRWQEIEAGTLSMAREPRMLYVLDGSGFDAATGTVTGAYHRWVLYWPYATPEGTGLSTKPQSGTPWLMYPGTAGAHIMISPPRK